MSKRDDKFDLVPWASGATIGWFAIAMPVGVIISQFGVDQGRAMMIGVISGMSSIIWLPLLGWGRYRWMRRKRTVSADQYGTGDYNYPDDWDDVRRRVYRRDHYRCVNCGATDVELHAHHIVPLRSGGTNNISNLTTVCEDCHKAIHPHMRS